jgi:hypothetical protein
MSGSEAGHSIGIDEVRTHECDVLVSERNPPALLDSLTEARRGGEQRGRTVAPSLSPATEMAGGVGVAGRSNRRVVH